jgi:hypothetical protein
VRLVGLATERTNDVVRAGSFKDGWSQVPGVKVPFGEVAVAVLIAIGVSKCRSASFDNGHRPGDVGQAQECHIDQVSLFRPTSQ